MNAKTKSYISFAVLGMPKAYLLLSLPEKVMFKYPYE